jgi:hypothetical protein
MAEDMLYKVGHNDEILTYLDTCCTINEEFPEKRVRRRKTQSPRRQRHVWRGIGG